MYVKGDEAGEPVLLCQDTVDFLVKVGLLNADELAKISLCKETIDYLISCGLLLKLGSSRVARDVSEDGKTFKFMGVYKQAFDLPAMHITGEDIDNPPIKIRYYEDFD